MARFVTPAGVEIETSERAGRAAGYKLASEAKAPAKRAPRKKAAETGSDEKSE